MENTCKKIIAMGVVVIMCLVVFTGCKTEFATDKVSVSVTTEYKDKFLGEEFTAEDFNWGNVERIEYGTWHSTIEPEVGYFTVYLKKHGKKHVNAAVEHFKTLVFVESVNLSPKAYMY